MSNVIPSSLLRLGLRLDAVISLGAAVLVAMLLPHLITELGFARQHLIAIAGFMFGWAAVTGWLGGQDQLPAWSVWLSVLVNIEWAAASLLIPAMGWITPTALGWAVLLTQASGVLAFALLQWLGLRRSERCQASLSTGSAA